MLATSPDTVPTPTAAQVRTRPGPMVWGAFGIAVLLFAGFTAYKIRTDPTTLPGMVALAYAVAMVGMGVLAAFLAHRIVAAVGVTSTVVALLLLVAVAVIAVLP